MKLKTAIFFLFLLNCILSNTVSHAQSSWCHPGAKWTYLKGMGMGGGGVVTMEYTGDTLIDGINCNKLLTTTYTSTDTTIDGNFYVYQDSNKVYVRRNFVLSYPAPDTTFHVLYDFNLLTGDSTSIVPYPNGGAIVYGGAPITFNVGGTDVDTINGEILKVYFLQPTTFFSMWFDGIFERIGSINSFMPQHNLNDAPYIFSLACYTDSSGWTYSNGSGPCGTLNINDPKPDFTIFPNPSNERFTIDLKNISGKKEVTVYSTDNSLIYKNTTADSQLQIDCKEWSVGCYFVQITNETRTAISRIVVVR